MFTDTIQIDDSLLHIIEFYWDDEMKHFQELYEVEIQSQDELDPWIKWCQQHSYREGDVSINQPVNHAFYHLMVLKSAHPQLFEHEN